jgi:LysR family cyn operon transcriptional activator
MSQDDIEVAVAEDRIDVGIAFTKPPATDEPRASDIEINTLFEEMLYLAVGNAHPRSGQKTGISVREFGKESLVLLDTHFELRSHIDLYCRKHDIAPRIAMETDSLSVIIEMIQVGPHATILPETIIRTQCGLYSISLSPEIPRKAITMICRRDGYKSPACLAFAGLASEWAVRRLKATPNRKFRSCRLAEEDYQDEAS